METVYENATKVDKRVVYTISASAKARTVIVKAGGKIQLPKQSGFIIKSTETVE